MKVYAFDVDETLEVSRGPVTLQSLMNLRTEGHVVGICGNWGLFCQAVRGWQHLVSFLNVAVDKAVFLAHLKTYVAAEEYVMVGNVPGRTNLLGVVTASADKEAAEKAGWRFLLEDDFSQGVR